MPTTNTFPESFNLDQFFFAFPESMKNSAVNGETHLKILKTQAKLLRQHLAEHYSYALTHAQALDTVVRSLGFSDYNQAFAHFNEEQQPPGVPAHRHIPASVAALLASRWLDKTGATEKVAKMAPDRIADPSSYLVAVDGDNSSKMAAFSYAEVVALAREKAFGKDADIASEGIVVVNEHAMHSLEEFLGEVSKAWDEHQARLAAFVVPGRYRGGPSADK